MTTEPPITLTITCKNFEQYKEIVLFAADKAVHIKGDCAAWITWAEQVPTVDIEQKP